MRTQGAKQFFNALGRAATSRDQPMPRSLWLAWPEWARDAYFAGSIHQRPFRASYRAAILAAKGEMK